MSPSVVSFNLFGVFHLLIPADQNLLCPISEVEKRATSIWPTQGFWPLPPNPHSLFSQIEGGRRARLESAIFLRQNVLLFSLSSPTFSNHARHFLESPRLFGWVRPRRRTNELSNTCIDGLFWHGRTQPVFSNLFLEEEEEGEQDEEKENVVPGRRVPWDL